MIIKYILDKDREFVSQYVDTKEMTDEEVEAKLDEIIRELDNEG